jgi:hypothetical protein
MALYVQLGAAGSPAKDLQAADIAHVRDHILAVFQHRPERFLHVFTDMQYVATLVEAPVHTLGGGSQDTAFMLEFSIAVHQPLTTALRSSLLRFLRQDRTRSTAFVRKHAAFSYDGWFTLKRDSRIRFELEFHTRLATPVPGVPEGVAEGGYGCVVRPAYKCTDNTALTAAGGPPRVGKLMTSLNATLTELASADAVRQLDPDGAFSIVPLGVCTARPQEVHYDAKCKKLAPKLAAAMGRNGGNVSQLVSRDGGTDWGRLPDTLPLAEFLRSATPIITGLVRLKAAGVAHSDIKPGNITYKDGESRLVDWGIAVNASAARGMYERWDDTDTLAFTYAAYPPEFDVLAFWKMPVKDYYKSDGGVRNTDKASVQGVVAMCAAPACHSEAAIDAMRSRLQAEFAPPDAATGGFSGFLHRLSAAKPQLWSKVDLYGLGMAMGQVVAEYLPTGTTNERYRRVIAWIAAVTHFNVYERLTPEEALAQWHAIWAPKARRSPARNLSPSPRYSPPRSPRYDPQSPHYSPPPLVPPRVPSRIPPRVPSRPAPQY